MEAAHGHAHDHEHAHHPSGIMRWVTTTNHKDIGTMHLRFSFIMFITGGEIAVTIRARLISPGVQIGQPAKINQLVTNTRLIMMFRGLIPGLVGVSSWR